MALCALYHAEMNQEPLQATEMVYGTGDACQIQMAAHGYKRFYKFSRLDGKNPKKDKKNFKIVWDGQVPDYDFWVIPKPMVS